MDNRHYRRYLCVWPLARHNNKWRDSLYGGSSLNSNGIAGDNNMKKFKLNVVVTGDKTFTFHIPNRFAKFVFKRMFAVNKVES